MSDFWRINVFMPGGTSKGLQRLRGFLMLVTATTLALTFSDVKAADWLVLSINKDGWRFADADSVQRKGAVVTVWVKHYRNRPEVKYTAAKTEYDCAARTYRNVYGVAFDNADNPMDDAPPDLRLRSVIPDSVADGLMNIFCDAGFPHKPNPSEYAKTPANNPEAFSLKMQKLVKE